LTWLRRDRITVEWRKPHTEEPYDFYCSPNIVWVIKPWRMRGAGDVARMGERIVVYRILVGKSEGKRQLG
jgi:hypothetical protein